MEFKVGRYHLNQEANYNFQLGRLINWDGGDLEEVKRISHHITSGQTWKEQLVKLGDTAYQEGRMENAIAYYRMSEFFLPAGDADKLTYYRKAVKLFYEYYDSYFTGGIVQRLSVDFEDMKLPVLYTKSRTGKKGTILFHGGNDSCFEELFFPMLYFAEHGYDVYLFEGPGQGGVLREQGKPFICEWERPVKAVIDYFDLNDVIIIGVSLGGMLAPRAAAFEKRIKYIVGWSAFPSFLHVALYDMPKGLQWLFQLLLKCRMKGIINGLMHAAMKQDTFLQWVFEQGTYAYGVKTPYEYIARLNDFQMLDVAESITQDILILQGKADHFIDWRLYQEEVDSLKNARSITVRLFSDAEQASDHCQCGNTKLALDTILHWMDTLLENEKQSPCL